MRIKGQLGTLTLTVADFAYLRIRGHVLAFIPQ
jgi:hypothetical protein